MNDILKVLFTSRRSLQRRIAYFQAEALALQQRLDDLDKQIADLKAETDG